MKTGKWWNRPYWSIQEEKREDKKYFHAAGWRNNFYLRRLTSKGIELETWYSKESIKMSPPPDGWSPRAGE